MASVTIDLTVILGAFGGVVTALVWMYKSYDKRLTQSIERCQAENAKHEQTIAFLNVEIKELRTQLADLNYKVGFLTGREKTDETQSSESKTTT
jgi:uncharacterized coiled-coil protein SlyX